MASPCLRTKHLAWLPLEPGLMLQILFKKRMKARSPTRLIAPALLLQVQVQVTIEAPPVVELVREAA